ncbi:MAG: DUF4402 domain-containing protein [Bacteroidota bacterium]|nr:DUF4402 domain-containing protein [Bacteroidota bacterium]
MILARSISLKRKQVALLICGIVFLLLSNLPANAQITVTTAQNLSFGAFFQGNIGGTVTISHNSSRSATGGVILANIGGFTFLPAIFEVEAPVGTVITIQNGSDVTLTGNNGGSMTLSVGSSSTGSPFTTTVAPPGRTQVSIGATLTVGSPAANPSGTYNGSLSVTFIQQ